MTFNVINSALISIQLVLIYLSVPVLTVLSSEAIPQELAIHESYIGEDPKTGVTCVLTNFRVTVTIKPSNDSFQTTTFRDLTPETAQSWMTSCPYDDQGLVQHYYRFNDSHSDSRNDSLSQSLLSVGFEISPQRSASVHFKFVQIVCHEPNGCFRKGYIHLCNPRWIDFPTEAAKHNCYFMSASYHLDWIKANQSHQCSHNSMQNIKDVIYISEEPILRGFFDIDMHFYRVDAITGRFSGHFNPVHYCIKDYIFDKYVLMIMGAILCLTVMLMIFRCLVNCRRSAKMNKSLIISNGNNICNETNIKCVLEDDGREDEDRHESQLINTEL